MLGYACRAEAEVAPAVPDLVNLYLPKMVFVWCAGTLGPDPDDVEIQKLDVPELGTAPQWWVQYDGPEDVFGGLFKKASHWSVLSRNYEFLLRNGIAPGQPFLMWIGKPEIWKDYWSQDYDIEYPSGLIRALPMPHLEALQQIAAAYAWLRMGS